MEIYLGLSFIGVWVITMITLVVMLKEFTKFIHKLTESLTVNNKKDHRVVYFNKISPKEWTIVEDVASGLTNKQIAQKHCLSVHTIDRHVKNILKKVDAQNRADLTRLYMERKNG